MKRRSIILLLASLVATACFAYVVSYMSGVNTGETGAAIAMAMATPSVICSGIGTLFCWIGWFSRRRGFALTAGILFAVAMVLMIPWLMFNVIQMVLAFIAFATMKKG